MKKHSFAVLLVAVLTVTGAVFATQAETNETARLNQISQSLEVAPLDFSQGNIPVCPYCGTAPESWQVLEACTATYNLSGDAHYYLAEDHMSNTHYYNVNKSANICLYLNGKDILTTKRFVFVDAGATLNIMGTKESSISSTAADETTSRGDALDSYSGTINVMGGVYTHASKRPIVMLRGANSTLNIYEGTLIQGVKDYATPLVNVSAENCVLNMYGGEITGGKATSNGGNIYATGAGVQINLHGGKVTNGTANSGGNISATSGTAVTIYGNAEVSGGTATGSYSRGGNIFVGTDAALIVTGGTISGGHSDAPDVKRGGGIASGDETGGGNILVVGNSGNTTTLPVLNMTGGTVSDGAATVYGGGNLYVTRGQLTMTDGTVSGGEAAQYGGNLFLSGAVSSANISGGTITGGFSNAKGGNVYIASLSVIFNLTGGSIENGTARGDGGNIYANNGRVSITGGTVSGGKGNSGGNIHLGSGGTNDKLTLGNCVITGGTAELFGNDIYLDSDGKLLVKSDFARTSRIYVNATHQPETGCLNAELDACEGTFPGQLLLENVDGSPSLYGVGRKGQRGGSGLCGASGPQAGVAYATARVG